MDDILGLEGKPSLVVGGGYGIGRATARLLAKAGARVAVADIDPARARKVAEEIGGLAVAGDVTTEAGAKAVVDEAHSALGGLARVANIVGRAIFAKFLETGSAEWEVEFRMNLYQQMYVAHAAGHHMLAEGGGAIAMVASVSGIHGARGHLAYGAAKAGVISLAKSLSDEWAGNGVRINTVAPDLIAAPRMIENKDKPEAEIVADLDARARAEGIPVGRFGRPEEIAGPLVFLLSDLSSFMTGQCLVVDGGTMALFPHGGVGRSPAPPSSAG